MSLIKHGASFRSERTHLPRDCSSTYSASRSGKWLIFGVRQKIMKPTIKLTLAFLSFAASLVGEIIQKPGVYRPKGATTTLRISDSEAAVAKFEYVTSDGRKTQSEVILGAAGTWACFLEGESTVWIYQEGKSSVLAISILPAVDERLQFRTSTRKVIIAEEGDTIPVELRAVIR